MTVAFSTNIKAQEKEGRLAPSYFQGTLTEANELAESEDRKFFVLLYENEDHDLLTYFKEELLADSSLVEFLNESFVCLYEQKDSNNGMNLIKQFGVTQFPIILLVSTDGEILHDIVGKIDPDQMIDEFTRKVLND